MQLDVEKMTRKELLDKGFSFDEIGQAIEEKARANGNLVGGSHEYSEHYYIDTPECTWLVPQSVTL